MSRFHGRIFCLAIAVCMMATASSVCAQTRSFNIAPQSANDAIPEFARQAGVQIVAPSTLDNVRTHGIHDVLDVKAALSKMLDGTGLEISSIQDSVIVLRKAKIPARGPDRKPIGSPPAERQPPSPTPVVVTVTGTRIRGMQPVGSHVISVTRRDILMQGSQTTSGLLATLPALSSFNTHPHPDSGGALPTTAPDIHGLGGAATLVLVNGHRLPGAGILTTYADPSLLPLGLIDRIEVVADGSSAIYGSDAVGGVLNFILRKRIDGTEASAGVGFANGYYQKTYELSSGRVWSTGTLAIAYQFEKNTALTGSDRSYNTGNLTHLGGGDSRSLQSPEPNVTINGVTYAAPAYNPGTLNRYDLVKQSDLIPAERHQSVFLNFQQTIGERITINADLGYMDRWTTLYSPQAGVTFSLTSSNPYFRDFSGAGATTETVSLNLVNFLGLHRDTQHISSFHSNIGAAIDLNGGWVAHVNYLWGHSDTEVHQYGFSSDRFDAAVISTDPAKALDPFGGHTTLGLLGTSDSTPRAIQTITEYNSTIDGTLFHTPSGNIKLALGATVRKEKYDATNHNFQNGALDPKSYNASSIGLRHVTSYFAEVMVPLASEIPGFRQAFLDLAVRHDAYSDAGETTNPKIGLNWRPVDHLKLRASYGTSFHAPSQADVNAIDTRVDVLTASEPGVLTPNDGKTYDILLIAGGSKGLKPETALTYTAGFDYTPAIKPNVALSGTFFHVNYKNVVGTAIGALFRTPEIDDRFLVVNPSETLIQEKIAGLVINGDRSTQILPNKLLLDLRRYNLGATHVEGVDFNASYIWRNQIADIRAALNGTYLLRYRLQVAPGAAFFDTLENGRPRTSLRGEISFDRTDMTAKVVINYIGSYKNGPQAVGAFTTFDADVIFNVGKSRTTNCPRIAINIDNLLDQKPPSYNGFLRTGNNGTVAGFNPAYSNALGRAVSLEFRMKL
jgi:iron complex outermembrane receptor protein